ncbi:hypothetical protein FOZ60_003793 [Perkinsus olseni]|uniref:Reverse transcriptase domain-containing protein n=1 Tax=Perkinsus olseni TaxID=32597 RepID=A0A7J6NUI3_PEROL|nr:hypothetical protein FOZ60_003793 [Perkinsus olseni]
MEQQQPQRRSPTSLIERFEAAKVDIEPLRRSLGVDDATWVGFTVTMGGEPGSLKTVGDVAFLNDADVTVALNGVATALARGRVGVLYDACREQCGLAQAMANTAAAVVNEAASGGEPAGKKAKMAVFVDSVDDTQYELLPPLDYNDMVEKTKSVFGDISDDQLPSLEQLSGLQAKLNEGGLPFADFSVWAPRQRFRLKEMKLTRWTFDQDGQAVRVGAPSVPTYREWRKSFVIYKYALIMLGAASLADMEAYMMQIEHLYSTYGDEYWSFLVEADELLRSSRLVRYVSGRLDVARWGHAFRAAAADYSFWNSQMDRRVIKVERERASGSATTGAKAPLNEQAGKRLRDEASGKPPSANDKRREICFAYQGGREGHTGAVCPQGRRHVCLACKKPHDLPRGNRECPSRDRSKRSDSLTDGSAQPARSSAGCNNEAVSDYDGSRDSPLTVRNHFNEDQGWLGGLRRTVLSSEFLKEGRESFRRLREVLESIVLPRLDGLSDVGRQPLPEDMVNEARQSVIEFCGGSPDAAKPSNPHSPLRGGLWALLISLAGDWDTEIPKWLSEQGAPIGVTQTIRPCGVFPLTEDCPQHDLSPESICLWERIDGTPGVAASADPEFANYPSAEQRPDITMALLQSEADEGFCEFYRSREELVASLGSEKFLVSRLALAPKPNGKWRLICDATASGLNDAVVTSEKVILPRPSDLVSDILDLGQLDGNFESLEFLSVDFRSAFKLIAVNESERFCQICRFGGFYIKFNVLMFGTRSSPLVFCRVSSCACRLAQLLYDSSQMRISCYVDDPAIIARGRSPRVRKLRMVTVLLLWALLGIPLSVEKGQRGRCMKWIGLTFTLAAQEMSVSVPREKIIAMYELASELLESPKKGCCKALRKLCGKTSWAGNVVPYLHAFLAPLWQLSAFAHKHGKSHVSLQKALNDLQWLGWFFRSAMDRCTVAVDHCLTRRYRLSCRLPPRVCIVVDASTVGIGGALMWGSSHEKATPVSYFADAVSDHDVELLGAGRGSCSSQSCFELLAIVVALKLWSSRLYDCSRVVVESDSLVALSVMIRQRSSSLVLRRLVEKVAMMMALDLRLLEVRYRHMRGSSNVIADALSRLGEGKSVPQCLRNIPRMTCPTRDEAFGASRR